MNIILYILIFMIGTVCGSFFTLAVYRIPLGENIVYKHSFCPNCKKKLQFKELIPVISYIALRGKCGHCGQKIRIRYLLLEILSGLVFVLFALSLKVNIFDFNSDIIAILVFSLIYISSLFIIAGIDKEKIQVQESLLVFGVVLGFAYMIYVCIQGTAIIYTYIIYLALLIIFLIIDKIFFKEKSDQRYILRNVMLIIYMTIFSGTLLSIIALLITLIYVAIKQILKKRTAKIEKNSTLDKTKADAITDNKENRIQIPIGFCLCVSNISLIIVYNFLCNWVI